MDVDFLHDVPREPLTCRTPPPPPGQEINFSSSPYPRRPTKIFFFFFPCPRFPPNRLAALFKHQSFFFPTTRGLFMVFRSFFFSFLFRSLSKKNNIPVPLYLLSIPWPPSGLALDPLEARCSHCDIPFAQPTPTFSPKKISLCSSLPRLDFFSFFSVDDDHAHPRAFDFFLIPLPDGFKPFFPPMLPPSSIHDFDGCSSLFAVPLPGAIA